MQLKKAFLFVLLFLSVFGSIAQEPKLMLPIGHNSKINNIYFSPDQKRALSISDEYTVRIWDVFSGRLLTNLSGHSDLISSASYSRDGSKIVTSSYDSTIKIWNAQTGMLIKTIKAHSDIVDWASISPDNKKILTVSADESVKIWDLTSYEKLFEFKYIRNNGIIIWSDGYRTVDFSENGKFIAIATENKSIEVWDTNTGKLITRFSDLDDNIRFLDISYDSNEILAGLENRTTLILDIKTNKILTRIKDSCWTLSGKFSADNSKIAIENFDGIKIYNSTGGKLLAEIADSSSADFIYKFISKGENILFSRDESIELYNASNGKKISSFQGFSGVVTCNDISPDGTIVAFGTDNGDVYFLNINSGKLVSNLKSQTYNVRFAVFSPDGEKIFTASDDSVVHVWDKATCSLLMNLVGHKDKVNYLSFSPDGKKIATASSDKTAKVWDANSGNLLLNIKGHFQEVNQVLFSPDGNKLLTCSQDRTVKLWNVTDGKLLQEIDLIEIANRAKLFAAFTSDGDKIITVTGGDSGAKLWDLQSGNLLLFNFPDYSDFGKTFINISESNKKIVTTSYYDFIAQIWDANTGKPIKNLEGHSDNLTSAIFSNNGKILLTSSKDNSAKVWDVESGKQLLNLTGHSYIVNFAVFDRGDNRILTASADHTSKIWDGKYGTEIVSFFAVDSTDYFVHTPTGYYKTTPKVSKLLHYVSKDLKVITFEQLDVKYNRPDKVLEAIGNTDTALIKSYRKAWEKRIKKLGIDTTQFRDGYSVPEADFVNRDSIEYEQKTGTLRLRIRGTDSTYKLDRFNVWVNESPLFGQRGISIKRKNNNSLDTTITIKLSQGENRIETSITNVNGTESYRMPLYVNYTPAVKQKEMIRFIGIGIDRFTDSQHNLEYSSKDIRDLSVKLKHKYKDSIIIDTLFNENVTTTNVKALKQKLMETSVNDKVIISYSGHGLLSKEYDYYLSTYSVNFNKPEENGLPYDELESLLDSIPARKKLMLIDACHSGEVDKEEGIAMQKMADSLGLGKGIDLGNTATQTQHVGLKNSFELMQSLFVNVGKSTGATIISAAAGNQFALERGDLKNGVFTYSLLEAMNKYPTIKISELKKIVGERVEQLTGGLQKPTSRNETIAVDWSL